jgi:integrase/recombinase XerD
MSDTLAAENKQQPKRQRKRDRLEPRKVSIKGHTLWQVNLGSEIRKGKRKRLRRTFADRNEALTFAQLKIIERNNHGVAGISMPERLRGEALEAARLLQPYRVSVLDAAREYVRRHELITKSETVTNAVQLFLATKADDNLRPRYLEDLRGRLSRFAQSFGERKIADISSAEIDQWLRDLHQAPLSRNTFHLRLHTLYEYARMRGWVETNPLAEVPRAKVVLGSPGILTVDQTARLLERASTDTLPYWAIGVFAGLRSGELERLEWRDIRFDEGLVEVPTTKSKTASRRFVKIRPNLAQWLASYRGRQGRICPTNLEARLRADRKAAGITKWPVNGARHSFASYHLSAFRDVKELALELGHTRSEVTFRHYRELVTPSEAERFWKIAPVFEGEAQLGVVA